MDRLEDQWDALNARLDAAVELWDHKLQLVLDRMDDHIREIRVMREAIVEEHRADRRLFYSTLGDHRVQLEALEQEVWPSRGRSASEEP